MASLTLRWCALPDSPEPIFAAMSEPPCASVVIPCLNESRFIGPCLDALGAQEGVSGLLEVLVVDGGATTERGVVWKAMSPMVLPCVSSTIRSGSRPWP